MTVGWARRKSLCFHCGVCLAARGGLRYGDVLICSQYGHVFAELEKYVMNVLVGSQ